VPRNNSTNGRVVILLDVTNFFKIFIVQQSHLGLYENFSMAAAWCDEAGKSHTEYLAHGIFLVAITP
jgi:hypothetical protein